MNAHNDSAMTARGEIDGPFLSHFASFFLSPLLFCQHRVPTHSTLRTFIVQGETKRETETRATIHFARVTFPFDISNCSDYSLRLLGVARLGAARYSVPPKLPHRSPMFLFSSLIAVVVVPDVVGCQTMTVDQLRSTPTSPDVPLLF